MEKVTAQKRPIGIQCKSLLKTSPCLIPAMHLGERATPTIVSLGKIRLQLDCLIVTCERLFTPSEFLK